jgi:integrative and conjugative element protein (TIGR02256 family)
VNEGLSLKESTPLFERMVAALRAGDKDRLLDMQDEAGVGVYVARETFDVEYNGRSETITAGRSHIRAGHEILRGREHLFERATDAHALGMLVTRESVATEGTRAQVVGSPPSWSGAAGRSSPSRGASTVPVRLRSGPPTESIRLGAWSRIREESRSSSDGRETGGFLFASSYGSALTIVAATGPGERAVRERDRCVLDGTAAFERELEANDSDLVRVGGWHVHPSGGTEPSETDLRSWAAGFEILEERAGHRAVWSALIVTPGRYPSGGDIDPRFAAYVVRRDPISRSLVCERAEVLED